MKVSVQRAIAEALPVKVQMRVQPILGYDPSPDAVVLSASRDWLLVATLDFGPSGYMVVSRHHVRTLQTSKFHSYRKRVAQKEGLWPRKLPVPAIDLTSIASILRSLHKLSRFCIVLREIPEEWYSLHCRIEQVTDEHALLLGFDGTGRWERRPQRVDLSEIDRIYFGSQYLEIYEKHALKANSRAGLQPYPAPEFRR